MLSRAANDLYWIGRHVERAENTARMLDVTYRTSLLPYHEQEPGLAWAEPWAVPLVICGLATGLLREASGAHGRERAALHDPRPEQPVVDLVLPARGARVRARGARRDHLGDVRGPERRLARDAHHRLRRRRRRAAISEFFDWVKMRSHLFRGVTVRHDAARRGLPASCASAPTSSAPTTPRASSTPSTTSCCRRRRTSAARSTTTSGRRCCARSPRSSPTARSTAT